ncbi:MAG: hypothetical protein DRI98_06670 [Bacteroidetes bacterium]|nr:MAG: hypothetical protein DRI98_06670 [Bacteroidota bacterium]
MSEVRNPWDKERVSEVRKARGLDPIPKKKKVRFDEPWYEDLAEGAGVSALETYYGVKDLFGSMDDEDRDTLKDWQEDAAQSGWGTGGQILGEIAQFALPGGVALKALRGAGKGLKSIAGAESLIGAGLGGLKLPQADTDETRGSNALFEGATSLVGSGVGSALGGIIKGSGVTKHAKDLLDKGYRLTPGQASTSEFVQGLEGLLDFVPSVASGARKRIQQGKDDWSRGFLKKAAHDPEKITEVGEAGFRQVSDQTDALYDKAWKGIKSVQPRLYEKVKAITKHNRKGLSGSDGDVLKTIAGDAKRLLGDGKATPENLVQFDKIIRSHISGGNPKKFSIDNSLREIRDEVRKGFPDDVIANLKKADANHPNYKTVETAASKADGGVISPITGLKSSKSVGGSKRHARGESPIFDFGKQGLETVGRTPAEMPLSGLKRIAHMFPQLVPLEGLGNLTMGRAKGQKAVSDFLEKNLPKNFLSAGNISNALYDHGNEPRKKD